jgi:hypothetical protein
MMFGLGFEKDAMPKILRLLTCACVNKTRRFRRCVSGNCIGFESLTLHAASPDMFDIACPIDPPADPPINLVTAKKKMKTTLMCYQHLQIIILLNGFQQEPSKNHHVNL